MPDERIAQLAEEVFASAMAYDPLSATLLGVRGHDHEVPDLTRQAEDARIAELGDESRRAAALDGPDLDDQDRVTLSVIRTKNDAERALLSARSAEVEVSPIIGAQAAVLHFVPKMRLTDPDLAEAYLERVGKLDRFLDQAAGRHREGLASGRTPPARNIESSIGQIEQYLDVPLDRDPLAQLGAPDGWGREEAWREELRRTVDERVRPAMAAFRDVLADEILPRGRSDDRPGVQWIDGGRELYRDAVAWHTTTDRDPQEIHDLGLRIIADLADEYVAIGADVLGTRDVREMFDRIRNDPDLRYDHGQQIVDQAAAAVRRAADAAAGWFGHTPSVACEVRAIPEEEGETAPFAYYHPPAQDWSQPGVYWQNVSHPEQAVRVTTEAVAFHEAIPGHHFQIALAQSLDLPDLRRHGIFTAYVEGWGLYAERLADEMGLYGSDLDRLGMLSNDSLRAGRLVTDTGLHHLGWSRQQAVEYLVENTPVARREIETEVDRYIAMPGQALGYMVGRREIVRLRQHATQALGAAFDLPSFHDVVLTSGPVPLNVLAEIVDRWIAA